MISPFRKIAVFLLTLLLLAAGVWFFTPARRPHIILITLDTTRADRLGCYGYTDAATPAIDGLAERGVLFESAYTPVPLTLPAHASLMTGLYPPEHGIRFNGISRLDKSVPTLGSILKDEGYRTGAFVAAFVLDRQFGLDTGFDIYDDDLSTAEPLHDRSHMYRAGKEVVDSALRWLRVPSDEPIFCWIHLYEPHDPYLTHPQLFGDAFADRAYDAEIAYVDGQIQRVLDQLKQQGIDDETYVIVVGDHGEGLGEHEERTHGYMTCNSTMHVPLIVAGPNAVARPHRVPETVSLIDLFPTLLSLLEIEHELPHGGRSLVPAFSGQPLDAKSYYGETMQPQLEVNWATQQCLISNDWKYIRTKRNELYDLEQDAGEEHNLAAAESGLQAEMEERLANIESEMVTRTAVATQLSSREQRALESLGYASGPSGDVEAKPDEELHDMKDTISHFYDYRDALELMHENKYAQAREILVEVIAALPDYFVAHCNLGTCHAALENFDQAAENFRHAIEIVPDPKMYVELGKVLIIQKKYDLAIERLETAVDLAPDDPMAHLVLGDAFRGAKDLANARREYEHALTLDPGFERAHHALQTLPF